MIGYHGSNVDFSIVDLNKCRNYTDFGKGFYLTLNKAHAIARAESKAKFFGGEPHVSCWEFELSHSSELKILQFEKETVEWADFVYRSRELGEENDYDVIIGPIADDSMRYLFRNVRLGQMTIPELLARLKYKEQSSQICFRTNESLKLLEKI